MISSNILPNILSKKFISLLSEKSLRKNNSRAHIEGDIMQDHSSKKKVKKVKNQDFMDKTNFFLSTLPFSPWVASATWVACRSSLENTGKMSLIPVFNKNSPWAHTKSELDVLGAHRKLVKYVVHLSKRKK
jgi:hypothetical protein